MSKLIEFLIVLCFVTFWAIGLKEYFAAKKAKESKSNSTKSKKKSV
jgi:hypothetical protein